MSRPTKQEQVKKELEIAVIRNFLEFGLRVTIDSLQAQAPPKPDALARFIGSEPVEIEHTDYQIDEPAEGNSPARKLADKWGKVIEHIHFRQRKLKLCAEASVVLNERKDFPKNLACPFAYELIRFAQEFCPKIGRQTRSSFATYPILFKHVHSVTVWPTTEIGLGWRCPDVSACFVGIVPSIIARAVRKKSTKTYEWTGGAEKWLLIVASAMSIASQAGPNVNPDEWDDPDLKAACSVAPFERIYFWEYRHQWFQVLK